MVARPAEDDATYSALAGRASAISQVDVAGLRAAYPTTFRSGLGYDPNAAGFLDRIQASALALTDGERSALGSHGFVVSTRREFGTFVRGMAEIYAEHLPLYVTADTLLASVHSSYDRILQLVEEELLLPELRKLLVGMTRRIASSSADQKTRADVDLYLTVAISLLDGKLVAPVAGASPERVKQLVDRATAASGTARVVLFDVEREEDFSQFQPRGHYDSLFLGRYFRAQMWLGRVDMRMLETQPSGTQVFRRAQYLSTLLFAELVGPDMARFERIEGVLRTFVGASDYMQLPEVAQLVKDLGGPEAARTAADDKVVAALLAGGYGKQQIASHLMQNGTNTTLPLNRSFALLGQRYVVDAHVLSEVVYDRLKERRMMPSSLDAAFAALGNSQALSVHPDVDTVSELPGALGRMRVLVDAHDDEFWASSFTNLWLRALRALSPPSDLTGPSADALPEVATTELWGRRVLSTQLSSWAELKHDTVLYAKQSYTGIPVCEYPDAYVDPYPAFYEALHQYALSGARIGALLAEVDPGLSAQVDSYFALLASATARLKDMAERELRGEPFTVEQLAFLNDAVRIELSSEGCTTIEVPDGWYAKLFFEPMRAIQFDPTIADIHTQPADAAGNPVGKVLHVGTGYPRMMVTTVDTCLGPRAYVGVVYAYHEQVTENFARLTDDAWAQRFDNSATRPADVTWMLDALAH